MLFLLFVAVVISIPIFIGEDGYDNHQCDGVKHYSEFSLLGMCRHRNDHSEKTTYHSYLQAEASFYSDKDCTGESKDEFIDLGCHHQQKEWERDVNITYYEKLPKGNLNWIYTTDNQCTKDFEGGVVFFGAQGTCTRMGRSRSHAQALSYTCNSTHVALTFYQDPECKSQSHEYDMKLGCGVSPEIQGVYVDVYC